jgi:hypothetical protein
MLRILRAFPWMRWSVLLNSLERTSARDTLERFSLAVDQLGPIIAAALLVPSVLGISALSAYAGFAIATGAGYPITFEVLRYLALGASALAVIGPVLMPVMEQANPVRLLLLPIPRSTLYIAQTSGTLADPWILLMIPVMVFLPAGLAAGGALTAAALALIASVLFLAVLTGLSMLTACVVQLVVRDRRRGELVALVFILVAPLAGMLFNVTSQHGARPRDRTTTAAPEHAAREPRTADVIARRVFTLLPSERYAAATRAGSQDRTAEAAWPLVALAATGLLLHGAALLTFERLLAAPASTSRRRTARGSAIGPAARIPFLSPGASAVALAQIRLALRTPRGRSSLLSPLIVFGALGFVFARSGGIDLGPIPGSGIGFATFGGFVSLLAILPLAMNQFAIDGAGLTLELLSPVPDRDLLAGKAAANGALAAIPAALCILGASLLFPGSPFSLWISVPLALLSVYLLVAPVAAVASTLFPKAVDLNSIGNRSNAHGVAALIGMGASVVSGLPPLALGLLATVWLERPQLAPLLLLAWCAVALALSRALFGPVVTLFSKRRENLGMV